jgi:polysaccharide pyruvyl transferase WcaK-like protein
MGLLSKTGPKRISRVVAVFAMSIGSLLVFLFGLAFLYLRYHAEFMLSFPWCVVSISLDYALRVQAAFFIHNASTTSTYRIVRDATDINYSSPNLIAA